MLLPALPDKVLSQEEIDALIAAASTPGGKEDMEDLSSVEQFIIALDIKPGKSHISAFRIWSAYQTWSKFPLSRDAFYKAFAKKLYQQKRRTGKDHYYLLDASSFDTTPATKLKQDAEAREAKEQRRINRLRKTHVGSAI